MLGSRELLESLAVSGKLVELLPVDPLGELQVRGPRGDLVLRVIEKVKVGKRGDGTLIRVEGQANWYSVICVRGLLGVGLGGARVHPHNPKVAGSNPAPATMKDEGLADIRLTPSSSLLMDC